MLGSKKGIQSDDDFQEWPDSPVSTDPIVDRRIPRNHESRRSPGVVYDRLRLWFRRQPDLPPVSRPELLCNVRGATKILYAIGVFGDGHGENRGQFPIPLELDRLRRAALRAVAATYPR